MALCRQGRFAEARSLLEPLARVDRPDRRILELLGVVYLRLGDAAAGGGDLVAALASYERSIAVRPDDFQVHYNRGVVLYHRGEGLAAAASYERALALAPGLAAGHSALGVVQSEADAHGAALENLARAVAIEPGNAEFHNNLGLGLDRAQRPAAAIASFDAAIALVPQFGAAWCNRGVALHRLGRFAEALASADRALAIDRDDAEAWSNRGLALHDLHRDGEAITALARATELAPQLANAWANLGATLNVTKRHDEALAAYDRALALDPRLTTARGDRLHTLMQLCDWRSFDDEVAAIGDAIVAGNAVVHPFVLLATPASAALQKRCAELFVAAHWPDALLDDLPRVTPRAAGDDRIRIGYFSADFRDHAMMHLIAELFERHDRKRFVVHAFSFGPTARDPVRERVMTSFDSWHEASTLGDAEVAALAREVGIDIAVDLAGFTRGARPGILAARAAPLQVSYVGFPGTLAAPFIDYVIADDVVIPAAARADFGEAVAWLPNCYLPNTSWHAVAPPTLDRAAAGLPADGFVFCSFNNSFKITPDVFAVWMRLLQRVERSALWLIEANASAAANLRRHAARHGVDGNRIVFAPRVGRDEHLRRHALADLFLDTFHYGAHTTASDALRAGLPVLTRRGDTFASRVAASLCQSVGLAALVVASAPAYEATALALATDPRRLAALRETLAGALPTAPLFDAARFAHDIERLYIAVDERRRAGLAPVHLDADRLPASGAVVRAH
ncbi:MAG TPA: tetratricopeptide repeat protein [Caldimonas sp.]|nr:tetratricopeptide repeat protein [Caldimonas sp.]HEX4235203.1 tetratricopeptide repeat protein [Caldimonas sp.]